MTDATYQKFVKRWEEVIDLPPQTVGRFTPLYKTAVSKLKVMPWPVLVAVSVAIIAVLFIFVGSPLTSLVSILQRGF